jgi:predicted phosphoribosyltransferase
MLFRDRQDAGRRLAGSLMFLQGPDSVVLGLPRGGVIVAAEVAKALGAPLDVVVSRKIGLPGHAEFGIGAVAPGVAHVDRDVAYRFGVPEEYLRRAVAEQEREVARREAAYRGLRPRLDLAGKTVIIVDDGLATGVTARAAIASVKARGPAAAYFAAPVCESENAEALRALVAGVICLDCPTPFMAVGASYEDFRPTLDKEVLAALASEPEAGRLQPSGGDYQ